MVMGRWHPRDPRRSDPERGAYYAQQVMALALQLSGVARPDLDTWLGAVAAEVPEADRFAVVRHMLEVGILAEDGGVLGLGERGEREFGRRHFSDLVAAFTSPLMLTVRHGAAELGTVQAARPDRDDRERLCLHTGNRTLARRIPP
jgi:ATP-dependent Lhr-like helicase